MKAPAPPKDLSTAGKALWRKTLSDYAFSTATDLAMLAEYVRTFDRLAEIRAAIAKDGITVQGSQGQPRQHPLLSAENDARRALIALARVMQITSAEE